MPHNPKQIKVFCVVVEQKNIKSAMETLHISQPAISKHIANLEYQLGFLLFKRIDGTLKLTPEGHYFYTYAKEHLRSSDLLEYVASQIKNQQMGELKIATNPGYCNVLMPQLVANFAKHKKSLFTSLQVHSSKTIIKAIQDSIYDIAVCEYIGECDYLSIEKFQYNIVCTVPKGHPLLEFDTLTPSRIQKYPLVTLNNDHVICQDIMHAFRSEHVTPNVIAHSMLFRTAAVMATAMDAISFVDSITARTLYKDENFEIRPFSPSIKQNIAIISNPRRPMSRITREFNETLSAKFKSLLE